MNKFKISPQRFYFKKVVKLKRKRGNKFKKQLNKTLELLIDNPFCSSLRTHKVITRYDGKLAFSSYVTGDLRLIWRFNNEQIEVIDLLDIGGHEGKSGVY